MSEIPDDVIEAAAEAVELVVLDPENGLTPSDEEIVLAAAGPIVAWARRDALREARDAVAKIAPVNCDIDPRTGFTIPDMAAWVAGVSDALRAVCALIESEAE